MKKIRLIIPLIVLFLFLGNGMAQQIIRTPFLQLGDAPFRQNITKEKDHGFSMYTVSSENLDEAVKEEIKAQKKQGFNTVDKANLLFGKMRTLNSPYTVEKGTTYRIVALSSTQKETFIMRATNEEDSLVVPEVQIPGDYRNGNLRVQLADYTPSKSGTIRLQNATKSMDSNAYSAVRYLIFKKKVK